MDDKQCVACEEGQETRRRDGGCGSNTRSGNASGSHVRVQIVEPVLAGDVFAPSRGSDVEVVIFTEYFSRTFHGWENT